jgi:hypothetical protein
MNKLDKKYRPAKNTNQVLGTVGTYYDNCNTSGSNITSITYPFMPSGWKDRISNTMAISGAGAFGYHVGQFFTGNSMYTNQLADGDGNALTINFCINNTWWDNKTRSVVSL